MCTRFFFRFLLFFSFILAWEPCLSQVKDVASAESMFIIYNEDWQLWPDSEEIGKATRLKGVDKPNLILAAWDDGRVVWSQDEIAGGPPYYKATIAPENFSKFIEMANKMKVLWDGSIPLARLNPHKYCTAMKIVTRNRQVTIRDDMELSEVLESSEDARVNSLSKDELLFENCWLKLRLAARRYRPSDGAKTSGYLKFDTDGFSWIEGKEKTEVPGAKNR